MTEQKTLQQKLSDFYLKKIDIEKIPVTTKAEFTNLIKLSQSEIKFTKGNWGYASDILSKILKEKNMSVVDKNPSTSKGNLKINVEAPPQPEIKKKETLTSTLQQSSHSTTTQDSSKTIQESLPIRDPKIEESNKAVLRDGFAFVGEVYSALGIIKGEGQLKIEDMTATEFKVQSDKFADRLGSFLFRHGIEIPWVLELLSLVGTAIILFGLPLIKMYFMKTKDAPEEKQKIEVELK